jgi:hypothetical protein
MVFRKQQNSHFRLVFNAIWFSIANAKNENKKLRAESNAWIVMFIDQLRTLSVVPAPLVLHVLATILLHKHMEFPVFFCINIINILY